MTLEERSPENAELIKSLRELNISDEEIAKSLNISLESEKPVDKIEKSIEEQIADKRAEIEELENIQKSNTPVDPKKEFEDIKKSLDDKLNASAQKVEDRFDKMVELVKSLTEQVVGMKNINEKLVKDNDDLKKSIGDNVEILQKLASFTPGLKSIKNMSFVERFQKSITDEGKEIMSVSTDKNKISSMLSDKMNDENFRKSYGSDVESFECSGRVSDRLEKAISNDLNIKLIN